MSVRPVIVVASPDRIEVAWLSDWLTAEGLEPVAARSLETAIHAVQSRTFDVLIADAKFAFDGDLQGRARTHNARAPLVVLGDAAACARAERNGMFHVGRPADPTGRPSPRSKRSSKGRRHTSSTSATKDSG